MKDSSNKRSVVETRVSEIATGQSITAEASELAHDPSSKPQATRQIPGVEESTPGKAKSKKELNSSAQVLESVFKPEKRKDGKLKPVRFTKEHESAVKRLDSTDQLTNDQISRYCEFVSQTDIEFRGLLDFTLATREAQSVVRQQLLNFSVTTVSRNWIGKHKGSDNLYQDIVQRIGFSNSGSLAYLSNEVSKLYEKRTETLKQPLKQASDQDTGHASELRGLTVEQLRAQRDRVLVIGYLWATEFGKCTPKEAIAAFEKLMLSQVKDQSDTRRVTYFLASQLDSAKEGIADTVSYYEEHLSESRDSRRAAEAKADTLQRQLKVEQDNLLRMTQQSQQQQAEIMQLKEQLQQAMHQASEQEQMEKAQRVHLRDDAGKAKSKAYNLLTEDVEAPLKLSLRALLRDNPKVEVAAHHIELVIESIERELPWFKK